MYCGVMQTHCSTYLFLRLRFNFFFLLNVDACTDGLEDLVEVVAFVSISTSLSSSDDSSPSGLFLIESNDFPFLLFPLDLFEGFK